VSRTVNRPRQVFEPEALYTADEVAERLKTTPKAIKQKVYKRELPEGGWFKGLNGPRIWGWALNQYLAEHSE